MIKVIQKCTSLQILTILGVKESNDDLRLCVDEIQSNELLSKLQIEIDESETSEFGISDLLRMQLTLKAKQVIVHHANIRLDLNDFI